MTKKENEIQRALGLIPCIRCSGLGFHRKLLSLYEWDGKGEPTKDVPCKRCKGTGKSLPSG